MNLSWLKPFLKQPYWVLLLCIGAAFVALSCVTYDKGAWSVHPPASLWLVVTGSMLLAVSVLTFTFSLWKGHADTPEINGHWQYECVARGISYSHGGDAEIELTITPYGPQWRLLGTRRWKEEQGVRTNMSFNWSTDWAAVTEKDRIKYTYRINTDKGYVIGYADGAIKERIGGKAVLIEGDFYQLPPLDPMYGGYKFFRS